MEFHIDADSMLYAVASGCDNVRYTLGVREWEYKEAAVREIVTEGLDITKLERKIDPEPWEHVVSSFTRYIEDKLEAMSEWEYKLFLTDGRNNFRNSVATILPYKGNRDRSKTPYHLSALVDHVVQNYPAIVCRTWEADDALGLYWEPDVIMAHIDKDILMVPGYHYNFNTGECVEVSPIDGLRYFYSQVLTGDKSTDNILGLFGVGPKSKHVKAIYTMEEEEDMFDYTLSLYESYFGNYGKQFLEETCKLIWVLRNPKYYPEMVWQKELKVGEYWIK